MFYILLLISLLESTVLSTALGECTIQIFTKDHRSNLVEQTIINYSNAVVNKFGRINPSPYSIDITTNIEEFYKKSRGKVPEWGIAVTKRNPNRIIMQSTSTPKIPSNFFPDLYSE